MRPFNHVDRAVPLVETMMSCESGTVSCVGCTAVVKS